MSDAWGTLGDRTRARSAAQGHADPTIAGADVSMASPEASLPAAERITVEADPALIARYRQCAIWCGYVVIAIGCMVLIGWFTGIGILTSLVPSRIAMKSNTALGLIVAGGSLCFNNAHPGVRARQMSRLCAVFVVVLASFTTLEHLSGRDLGIDQLLVTEPPGAIGTQHPGRMAPLAMLSFEILGISLLTKSWARSGWQILTSALTLLAVAFSMVVLLGYLIGAGDVNSTPAQFTSIAANASIAFLVLAVGILFTNLSAGLLRSLASPYLGGAMLRRMLPVVVALIIGVVWLRLTAQSAGLPGTGVASGTVVIIVAVEGILIWYAGVLDRMDGARRRGDEQIKLLNAALNSRVLVLEAANKEFQGLSYSMSHVLRAPLRAIHGYAQIVLDDLGGQLGSEGRRMVGVIQSSTEDMSELLDGILAFLRLGWQPMAIVPVDMRRAAGTAIALLESKTAERKIRFEVGDLPVAQADASMAQRVWLNLLDNAVKFTGSRDEARIEVGARRGSDETIYFVKDNGVGFDMRYVEKLFGIFQRLHDTTQYSGTGIGLAIVNRIVARHGGRTWAEGKPDEGATFYFTLPARENNHV